MGKGDRRTRRGKITKGTFGVRRMRKKIKAAVTKKASKTRKKTPKAKKEVEKDKKNKES